MGRKCCVVDCRSNYDANVKNGLTNVSTFKLPEDPELKEKWITAINRKNFYPSKNSCVCINHFHADDIERYDKPAKLKAEAVPSIAMNVSNGKRKLPQNSIKKGRQKKKKKQEIDVAESSDKNVNVSFAEDLLEDLILNFDNLKRSYQEKLSIDGWFQFHDDNIMHFFNVNDEDQSMPLKIENSIKIYDNLNIKLFLQNVEQSDEELKWILGYEKKIAKWSQFGTILNKYDYRTTRLRPKHHEVEEDDDDFEFSVDCLDEEDLNYDDEDEVDEKQKIKTETIKIERDMESEVECHAGTASADDTEFPQFLKIETGLEEIDEDINNDNREITFVDADTDPRQFEAITEGGVRENPLFSLPKKKKYRKSNKEEEKLPLEEKLKLDEARQKIQESKNKCFVCNTEHDMPEELEHHLPVHLKMLPYKCEKCVTSEVTVRTLVSLNNHYLMHEKPLKCRHCDVRFSTHCTRRSHEQYIHNNTGPIKCSVCNKEYLSLRGLKTHFKIHTNAEEFKCKVCEKLLSSTYELKLHMRVHTGEKPNKCPFCDAAFNRISNLTEHKRRFHSMERPFECKVCNMRVQSKLDLKKHMEIHDPQLRTDRLVKRRLTPNRKGPNKIYECKTCDKQFKAPNNYHSHMRQHDKKFQCSYCGVKIAQYRDFTDHENTHTGERPYECIICGLRFKTSSTYYGHRVVHTGEKNHTCEICGRAFSRYRHVVLHMRTHTGEKPFECKVCGKKYSDSTSFKKHQKSHDIEVELKDVIPMPTETIVQHIPPPISTHSIIILQ